jgi:hypothetical protein
MQAVERRRESNEIPASGTVSVADLLRHFTPTPKGSTRALILKMFEVVAQAKPWAVILCRFKGEPVDNALENPIETLFREIFTPGSGGLVEYWREVSAGALDISGSKVFGWVMVDITRAKAGGTSGTMPTGPGRGGLIDAAIRAVKAGDSHALDGFHGTISVYPYNWSVAGGSKPSEWIDGSANGYTGRVNLTPPFNGNITAHEMGHGFGMRHDVGSDLTTHYADPCCTMSQNGPFTHPRWQVAFGPAVCLTHLALHELMYKRRVYYDDGDWLTKPEGITLPLAPISCPRAHANLGIKLKYDSGGNSWDYYLEYAIPTEWNQGVPGAPYLFVRRGGLKVDSEETSVYLGAIALTNLWTSGSEQWTEPAGNVRFRVEPTNLPGPIIKVTARKL